MFNKLINTLTQEELELITHKKCVIGVSGGPDSIYLLHFLWKKKNKNVIVCTINYNLRKDSIKETKYVKEIAKKLNYAYKELNVKEKPEKNIQSWARKIRFKFFEDVMREEKINLLLLGTTQNDIIETFYMNSLQLKETPIVSKRRVINKDFKYTIFRPLYGINKKTIIKELQENKISYFIDYTNFENSYFRNCVRNNIKHDELFPYIIRLINAEKKIKQWKNKLAITYKKRLDNSNAFLTLFSKLDSIIQEEIIRLFLKDHLLEDELRNLGKRVKGLREFLIKNNSKGKFRITNKKYIVKNKKEDSFEIVKTLCRSN